MANNDGGPAYPCEVGSGVHENEHQNGPHTAIQYGMSLRDYFAAKFAAAWVSALAARHQEPGYCDEHAAFAAVKLGLIQADGMLYHRTRKEPS